MADTKKAPRRLARKLDLEAGAVIFTDLTQEPTVEHAVTVESIVPGLWAAVCKLKENADVAKYIVVKSVNDTVGDAASSADVDAIAAIKARVESLADGKTNARGDGDGAPRTNDLVEAVIRAQKDKGKTVTPEAAKKAMDDKLAADMKTAGFDVDDKTDDGKKKRSALVAGYKAAPNIRDHIAAIKRERDEKRAAAATDAPEFDIGL